MKLLRIIVSLIKNENKINPSFTKLTLTRNYQFSKQFSKAIFRIIYNIFESSYLNRYLCQNKINICKCII